MSVPSCASASPRFAGWATTRGQRLLLVARTGLDHPWLNAGTDRFVQEALARGATLDLLNHPNGRHAFDILDDDARTKEILRRALDFLRERLNP